jgi:probable LLM family oxidoreductase
MELGVYSFGDVQRDPASGKLGSTAQATRNLLEAIRLADQVGLDYFGIGEHHTREAPASAAPVILAAAATVTERIRLGSSVTVLSTDDPVRVFQQFATLDALSDGRAEITAGRGSSTESFPLFGYDLADYEVLYAEKIDLLQQLVTRDIVNWQGTVRPALREAEIVPQPETPMTLWVGTGGSPASSVRAGQLGLPVMYGILGGNPASFAPLAQLYRETARTSGASKANIRVAVANPGFIDLDGKRAKDVWFSQWSTVMATTGRQRGWQMPSRESFDHNANRGGSFFVGDPEEIAERIVDLHDALDHERQIFQMDVGHLPQKDFLRSIELLGTRVKPLVDAALGSAVDTPQPPQITTEKEKS